MKAKVESLHEHADLLRKRCPVGPVTLVTVPDLGKNERASCERVRIGGRDQFTIRIGVQGRTHEELLDLLCHEWAHALCWKRGRERGTPHSQAWGIAFAKCYRVVFG